MEIFGSSLADMLLRVAMFIFVQVLVYLILSNSSNIFSKTNQRGVMRSTSFRPARSVSIRRILAALADMPSGGEPSPPPISAKSPIGKDSTIHDHTS